MSCSHCYICDCGVSVTWYNGNAYSTWFGTDGTTHFWADLSTCSASSTKCSCDENDGTWRIDHGNLTSPTYDAAAVLQTTSETVSVFSSAPIATTLAFVIGKHRLAWVWLPVAFAGKRARTPGGSNGKILLHETLSKMFQTPHGASHSNYQSWHDGSVWVSQVSLYDHQVFEASGSSRLEAENAAAHMAYIALIEHEGTQSVRHPSKCLVCGESREAHANRKFCKKPCSVCGFALEEHRGSRYCRRPSEYAAPSSSSSSSSSPSSGPSSALPLIRRTGCSAMHSDVLEQKVIITDEILSILRIECDATRGSALRKFKAQFHPDRFEPELRAHMTSLFQYVEELIRRSQGG